MIGSLAATIPLPLDRSLRAKIQKDQTGVITPSSTSFNIPPVKHNPISHSGGLRSSIDIEDVLQLNSAPPIDGTNLKTPLGAREWLGEAIKRSKAAYAAGGTEAANSLADKFTQGDLDMIRAATGYNVVVLNGLTTVVDDNGNPPPEGIGQQIQNLVGGIEMARIGGALTGEMTPDFLRAEFAKYANSNDPGAVNHFPKEWLSKALDHLSRTKSQKYPPVDMRA